MRRYLQAMPEFPKAILFDFDGVLVDSEPHHLATFRAVLQENGLDIDEAEYWRSMLGMTDHDSFVHVYRKAGRELGAEAAARLVARKGEAMMARICAGEIRPTPGAREFVRAAAERCPLAICSGARRVEIAAHLQALGMTELFPVIVAAGEAPGKPDPAGYLLAMRQVAERAGCALTPGECLIVEDSPTVTTTTRAAGFRVLAVAHSVAKERLAHADRVVHSLEARSAWELIGLA